MQELRIKFLQEEIENFPDEPFNYYALALEYLKANRREATNFFDVLISRFPDYLPSYYQAANFFFEEENYSKAEEIFLNGMALAENQNNDKALKELKGSYAIFKAETDDTF